MALHLSLDKKIEYAEISALAHCWTPQQLQQFQNIYKIKHDRKSQEIYLRNLLVALDLYRSGMTIEEILSQTDLVDLAS